VPDINGFIILIIKLLAHRDVFNQAQYTFADKHYTEQRNETEYPKGIPRRSVPDFGRVFLMLKYTDITQNTYVQS
jgi:hypothetical protein